MKSKLQENKKALEILAKQRERVTNIQRRLARQYLNLENERYQLIYKYTRVITAEIGGDLQAEKAQKILDSVYLPRYEPKYKVLKGLYISARAAGRNTYGRVVRLRHDDEVDLITREMKPITWEDAERKVKYIYRVARYRDGRYQGRFYPEETREGLKGDWRNTRQLSTKRGYARYDTALDFIFRYLDRKDREDYEERALYDARGEYQNIAYERLYFSPNDYTAYPKSVLDAAIVAQKKEKK